MPSADTVSVNEVTSVVAVFVVGVDFELISIEVV